MAKKSAKKNSVQSPTKNHATTAIFCNRYKIAKQRPMATAPTNPTNTTYKNIPAIKRGRRCSDKVKLSPAVWACLQINKTRAIVNHAENNMASTEKVTMMLLTK